MMILGLHVGVSFAEFSLLNSAGPQKTNLIAFERVYLPRLSLKSGLQKFLQKYPEYKIEKVFFISNHLEKMAPFRMGGSTAHLVTEGFENAGWLSQVSLQPMKAQRFPAVQSQEIIFGINERVDVEGRVLQSLDIENLKAIVAKLNLMEIKKVCVHFLHSNKNPIHLKQTINFLKENSFEVFFSHFDSLFDLEKSRRVSLTAALWGTWEDIRKDIIAAFEGSPEFFILTSTGFEKMESFQDSFEALTSADQLWQHLPYENVVFLGFETFFQTQSRNLIEMWQSPWGKVYRPHCEKKTFSIQPTSSLQINFWNELDFSPQPEGYEPGPVAMGRGQKVTAFDLFYDELGQQDDIKDWVSASVGMRITSNLTALAKNSKLAPSHSPLLRELRENFKQRISLEIEPKNAKPTYLGFWSHLLGYASHPPRHLSEWAARLGMGAL